MPPEAQRVAPTRTNGARMSVIKGGASRFSLPEPGSQEFYLWVLILVEIGALIWLRSAFKTAQGG